MCSAVEEGWRTRAHGGGGGGGGGGPLLPAPFPPKLYLHFTHSG